MDPFEIQKMFSLEDTYWWFVARRDLGRVAVARYLRGGSARRVLDVGCGTGANLTEMSQFGPVVGLDRAAEALQLSRSRGHRQLVQGTAEQLPFRDGTMDVVLALDILEHVADDVQVLRECRRVLVAGGLLVLSAPAYRLLWSEHDVALSHHRRYTAGDIARRLRRAGLRPLRVSYAIMTLFPPIFLFRRLQRLLGRKGRPMTTLIPLPPILNRLFIAILWLESRLMLRVSLPAGVSLMAVARRPARPDHEGVL